MNPRKARARKKRLRRRQEAWEFRRAVAWGRRVIQNALAHFEARMAGKVWPPASVKLGPLSETLAADPNLVVRF